MSVPEGLSSDEVSPAQKVDAPIEAVYPPNSTTGQSRTMLLFIDNRGMCEACHQW